MPRKEVYQKYREKHLEYMKEYNKKNKEKIANWDKEHPEQAYKRKRKWIKKNRKKYNSMAQAFKKISLIGKKCELCGKEEKLHKHHPNYSEPLKVIILCPLCHKRVHKMCTQEILD